MRDQELIGLYEAYQQVHTQQQVINEEVEIASHYFCEMGLNEIGVQILIEELGVEEFAEFVYDISEEYYLTEARAGADGAVMIKPVTTKGTPFKGGKPNKASLLRLRREKAARQEAENKASESKPSGMKDALKRQSAVAAAANKQPKKPGFLGSLIGAVGAGIERHNAAMSAAQKTGKTISNVARKVGGVAREVGKGASGAARLAGHVARKGLNDEYIMEYLIDEGYADTSENALAIMENMSEEWKESILTEVSQDEFRAGMMKAAEKIPSSVHTPSRDKLFGSKEERSKVKLTKGVINPTPPTSANIRTSSPTSRTYG